MRAAADAGAVPRPCKLSPTNTAPVMAISPKFDFGHLERVEGTSHRIGWRSGQGVARRVSARRCRDAAAARPLRHGDPTVRCDVCAAADVAARATAVVGRAADPRSAHGVRDPAGGWTALGTLLRHLSSGVEPRGVAGSGGDAATV